MTLTLSTALGDRHLDVTLNVGAGQTLALVGPNGAGKSTVLEVLAGLVRPDTGRAVVGDQTVFDLPATWSPAHRRNVALLAQEPLLFPHLSVAGNVAFGPRCHGHGRAAANAAAQRWLAAVGAADLGSRRPGTLSGGQAQRVALARALATEPGLLLLDEPLAALDVDVAAGLRPALRALLAERTAILVTHEVLDVVLLADQVAVVVEGTVAEAGPTTAVLRQPRTAFAASLAGVNWLIGTAVGPYSIRTGTGETVFGEPDRPLRAGRGAVAVFRPASVSVHRRAPGGSPRNDFSAIVSAVEPHAHLVRVRAGLISADVTPESVASLGLAPGVAVHLTVKAAEVSLYERG